MPRCSAASCRNMGSHTFPKDPYLRSLWEKATNKENFKASKHSRLCYDHFTPSDYVDVCLSTGMSPFHRYLKKTAVPSIFPTKIQQSTNGASVIEARTARIQHQRKNLKKGAVPTLFIFSKQEARKSNRQLRHETKNISKRENNQIYDVYSNRNKNIVPTSYHVCTPDLGYEIVVPEAIEEANLNMKMSVDTSKGLKNIRRIIRRGVVPSVFTWSKTEHFKPKERRGKEHVEVGRRKITFSHIKTNSVGCKNEGTHCFPKDVIRRELWVKAVQRKHWTPEKWARLCANHFKPDDYKEFNSYTGDPNLLKILKKTAVPSVFSTPSKLFGSYAASFQQKKNIIPRTKIKNAVSPQITPKNDESTSSEINNALRNRSMRLKNRKAYLLNRRCSVPQCNTRPSSEISLHPCPNNAAVRNEWAEALRVSYQYVKNMVACNLHFTKLDFIQSKNSERVLKHSAVPSRYLPNRKKVMVPLKNKRLRKDGPSKAFERQQTMTDTVGETKEAIQEEVTRECRACLKKLDDKKSCCNVFQAWAPPWDGMEATIAEDLAKLANVEISETDRHSKVLCVPCYQRLLDAATFASKVRNCDLLLRMRFTAEIDMEKVWPKPIQVDKNINSSVFNNPMEIEIKQEVLSDEEYPVNGSDNPYVETELANLDIKIEPEELVEPPPMNITINGTISLDPLNSENKDVNNGTEVQQETQYIDMEVKQEPTSEGEQEIELNPDLSLECLLCTKSFHSVTGLKAHVIAQHSYKTVKRKANGSVSPEKKICDQYQCAICKRSFQTSTDLMVHETCHNKHACYGCTEKFDSFELLTRHRKRCKASVANSVQKLKTLEDVKRPLLEETVEYLEPEIEKLRPETTSKVKDDIEMKEFETIKDEDVEMTDLNCEQKDENSEEKEVDDKVVNDNKLESVNEEVENDKQLESIIQEQEVDNVMESESVIQEQEVNECRTSSIILSDPVTLMESESVIEEVDYDKQLLSVKEVDNDKKLESVVEAEDNELESLYGEEESVTKKAESEKEELLTLENKTESENKEIEEDPDINMKLNLEIHSTENKTEPMLSDADMPVESLDNDD